MKNKKLSTWKIKKLQRLAHKRLSACRWGPEFDLEEARIKYIAANPIDFLDVTFLYDEVGGFKWWFPETSGIDTKNKICVFVWDDEGVFFKKTGRVLLDEFKKRLEVIFIHIQPVAKDMNVDVVASFGKKEEKVPYGYFYQGEYYLWEE